MSWLKAIENILGAGEGGVNVKSQICMARVIRELATNIKIESELPMRYETEEAAQQSRDAWNNLSPKTKEIIEEANER